MDVLHVISTLDPSHGGPPTVVTRLAAAQARLGATVRLLCYATPGAEDQIKSGLSAIPGADDVEVLQLQKPGSSKLLMDPVSRRALGEVIPKCDVVHIHGLWQPILYTAAATARQARRPYVLAPHGMLDPWALAQKPLKKKLALFLGFRSMIRGAALVHALSEFERDCVRSGRFHDRVRIIPNGVFLEEIDPLPARGEFYAKHPALKGEPFILFLARLHPGKGLDYLADAFAEVLKAHPRTRLVVAGPDYGAEAPLRAQIAALGIADRVHIVGPLWGVEKFRAFVDAACFCLPSENEGFSISICEALACSRAAVITEGCHFPLVQEAGAAIVVPRERPAIAAALVRVLDDAPAAAAMGAKGRAIIESSFTWPTVARQSLDAYGTLA